jgi:hypothetical protein
VGGTGGFAEPLRFYGSLAIPAAAIADLDAMCDTDNIAAISDMLGSKPDEVREAVDFLRDVSQKIKALPSALTEEAAKQRLKELSEQPLDWQRGDDNVLRRRLTELGDQLKRIRRLKEGGIEAYLDQPDIQTGLQAVTEKFAHLGLFFVPVGELEDWVKHLMQDCPKGRTSKTERAALAAERIRAAPDKSGDIWAFAKTVLDHLRARENQH